MSISLYLFGFFLVNILGTLDELRLGSLEDLALLFYLDEVEPEPALQDVEFH